MDEGIKNSELIFRAGLALKAVMLKMAITLLDRIIKHLEWLKQHNIKPAWKVSIDKLKVKTTRTLCTMVEKQRDNQKEIVNLDENKLEQFKLDKQYELENYKKEINKAQKALDLAKESKDTEDIAIKQKVLDQALQNKTDFEYNTNKEILAKTHILEESKNKLQEFEYDLKVCNAELNALESNRNVETGRLKREYGALGDKYIYNEELEMNKENIFEKTNNKDMNQKVVNDIDNFKDTHSNIENLINKDNIQNDYECKEYYDSLENNIDKLSEIHGDTEKDLALLNQGDINNNEIDSVAQMLSKDEATLKTYKESKANGDFKVNSPSKNMELAIERG